MPLTEITYSCKFDNSLQRAMFRRAHTPGPRPLVVALHTWSYGCTKCFDNYCRAAEEYDWHLIFPEFRGPNWTPQACGSDMVVSDLEDAAAYMMSVCDVDPARVYLNGGSGGGHCTLLMAGRRPDLWTAVSAWCPISDIAAWHGQCRGTPHEGYADHIEKVCGGDPSVSEAARYQCVLRSPLTWLLNARRAGLPVDINTGVHDGHTGSVPISQAFNAFDLLAEEKDRFSAEEIDFMVKNEAIPEKLMFDGVDAAFGEKFRVLLRRQSAAARITIFEGGHNIFPDISFEWLARQVKGRAPDWAPGKPVTAGDGTLSM